MRSRATTVVTRAATKTAKVAAAPKAATPKKSGNGLAVLAKVQELGLLSKLQELRLLSKLEASGLTLSKIEVRWGLGCDRVGCGAHGVVCMAQDCTITLRARSPRHPPIPPPPP
jgi:hypothetical protein